MIECSSPHILDTESEISDEESPLMQDQDSIEDCATDEDSDANNFMRHSTALSYNIILESNRPEPDSKHKLTLSSILIFPLHATIPLFDDLFQTKPLLFIVRAISQLSFQYFQYGMHLI